MATSSIGFSFNINAIEVYLTPRNTPVSNELDSFGALLSTPRNLQEGNREYKSRLLDVFAHRSNSAMTGLVYGVTRDLGLTLYRPIKITRVQVGEFPAIEFSQSKVRIYSNIYTEALEYEFNRGLPEEGNYFLIDLVESINETGIFEVEILDSRWNYTRSDSIMNSSSIVNVNRQGLNSGTVNYLGNRNVLQGSTVFGNLDDFRKEIFTENNLIETGHYYINYETGVIKTYSSISANSVIRYSYLLDEFIPEASPVIIRPVSHPDFQSVMFHQIEQPETAPNSGHVTLKGSQIINELLSVKNTFFGP